LNLGHWIMIRRPGTHVSGRRRGNSRRRAGLRRRGAVTSPTNSFSSSRPRFEEQAASTRSARDGEANNGGSCGGDTAERARIAVVRSTNSGEVKRSARCTETATNDAAGLLTSRRVSWTASHDGTAAEARKQRRRREARVPAALMQAARARGSRVGGPGGGGALKRPVEAPWRAGHARGGVLRSDTGGGGAVESGSGTSALKGKTWGPHPSAAQGAEAGSGWRRWLAGPAGPHGHWAATRWKSVPRL
jgi:hypothetical protein